MNNNQEPNWQPIQSLNMIADMIDGQVAEAQEQYFNLMEARQVPHVLDSRTIQRTIKVFTEQQHFIGIYEKQLSKWLTENNLTQSQQNEISRLQEQVKHWNKTVGDILALAEELRKLLVK